MKNPYLILIVISASMMFFYGKIDIENAPFNEIPDIQNYRQMAIASPGFDTTVSRNFGYRILLPYMAGLMPFSIDTGFHIMTIVMSLSVPLILFIFLRAYGLKDDTSLYLSILFIAGRHTFGFPAWYFYDVHDLLTHAIIPLFFLALKKNDFIIMSILLTVGVMNRETVLFLVPPALFYYLIMLKDMQKGIRMIMSVLPAVIMFVALRFLIVTESGADSGLAYSLGKVRFNDSNKILDPVTYYRMIDTFIPLTLIPLVFFKTTINFLKYNTHFLLFVVIYVLSSFLAGDTQRLIVPVFPVFFLLLGQIFEKISFKRTDQKIILFTACILSIPNHLIFRFTLPNRDWKVILSFFTMTFVTAYFYKLKKERTGVLDSNSDI